MIPPSPRLVAIAAELRELEERRACLLTEQAELIRRAADTLPLVRAVNPLAGASAHASATSDSDASTSSDSAARADSGPSRSTPLTPGQKIALFLSLFGLSHRRLSAPLGKPEDRSRRILARLPQRVGARRLREASRQMHRVSSPGFSAAR